MTLGGVMNSKKDWHPADIIAVLKKKGTTLFALSRQSGYAHLQHWPTHLYVHGQKAN